MLTYLVERKIPAAFRHEDPATFALHARWAADAYRAVGAFWLGGVITDNGMFSLVTAEQEQDLLQYGRSLNFPDGDMVLRRVIRPIGPFSAQPRG
ncbi:hypothetical protein [uncultured Phenylobacterium sp.]|uniref:hypothetical protein n=1 Tax=uncultured Phenylobacterium sp. TaxID=349273 RepID=UPI0025F87352|nr:hypothetical protein [uncultured Phenylobacterium sp.]